MTHYNYLQINAGDYNHTRVPGPNFFAELYIASDPQCKIDAMHS